MGSDCMEEVKREKGRARRLESFWRYGCISDTIIYKESNLSFKHGYLIATQRQR
jgi:hypothetical protein